MKKSLISGLMIAVFLISMLGPLLYMKEAEALATADNPDWYTTVNGVLGTDYYSLYPYNKSSTSIGMSKYAEFIDNNTNVGLEYAYTGVAGTGRDPWAAPTGNNPPVDNQYLPKTVWINGWFIDITYKHQSWGLRNLWAGALFADYSSYGKPWLRVNYLGGSCATDGEENFKLPGVELNDSQPMILADGSLNPIYNGNLEVSSTLYQGGRKTNGTAYTEPIFVLYHGPRKFIAVLTTYIGDFDTVSNTTLPLLKLTFTVIFNKDKKEIVVLKDVKLLQQWKAVLSGLPIRTTGFDYDWQNGIIYTNASKYDDMDIDGGVLVQFSDRQEWDLGAKSFGSTPAYSSYAHYYTDGVSSNATGLDNIMEPQYTDYDDDWTILPTLPPRTIVNGITVNAWGNEPHSQGEYDVAQIISNDKKYVGWAAHWPSCSDWSVDALFGSPPTWYRAMKADDPHYIDHYNLIEPWRSPLVVGEWDFILSGSHLEQTGLNTSNTIVSDVCFRGVSVYGVTDYHDAEDKNFLPYSPSNGNVLDREVEYQLEEIFKPWDLEDCLKDEEVYMRWVQHTWGDGETKAFQLKYNNMWPDGERQKNWPNVTSDDFYFATWDEYEEWPERVLIDGVLMKPKDTEMSSNLAPPNGNDYFLWKDSLGFMWVNFTTAPAEDACIKILFSTGESNAWGWLTVGRDSATIDSVGAGMIGYAMSGNPFENVDSSMQLSGFDMQDTGAPNAPSIFSAMNSTALPTRDGYLDYVGAHMLNKGRAGLKDDYCSHENADNGQWYDGVPIASSSIINVGGPSASLTAQYFNDFDDAFATLGVWTPDPEFAWKIMPVSCWSLMYYDYDTHDFPNQYMPEYNATGYQTIGYGVISTYMDLNGTVGLNIWGYTGQDTYFTTWSILHSPVLALAMANAPEGLTSVILQFNYTLHPDDFCFVKMIEALGTISEYDVQKVMNDAITETTRGSNPPEDVHQFNGALPEGWFKLPDDWSKSHYVEDWIGFNEYIATDPNWVELKYPKIHPDP